MAIKLKIKRGDKVRIITGEDRGKEGEVTAVLPKTSQVIVGGCKVAKKAVKPSDKNKEGGFIPKEMPIHISNVQKVEG